MFTNPVYNCIGHSDTDAAYSPPPFLTTIVILIIKLMFEWIYMITQYCSNQKLYMDHPGYVMIVSKSRFDFNLDRSF